MRSLISIRGCVRQSISPSFGPSVRPSVGPSVTLQRKSWKKAIFERRKGKGGQELRTHESMTTTFECRSTNTITSTSRSTSTPESASIVRTPLDLIYELIDHLLAQRLMPDATPVLFLQTSVPDGIYSSVQPWRLVISSTCSTSLSSSFSDWRRKADKI